MATAAKTSTNDKPNKDPKSLVTRIDEQLSRAVLSKKITKEQLTALAERITKLQAFMS